MKISRKIMAALGAVTMLTVAAGSASAASIFGGAENQIGYHNYENVFDSTGNIKTGPVAVGDYIVGILEIDQIVAPGFGGTTFNSDSTHQITGIFEQKVTGKVDNGTTTTLTLGFADGSSPTSFHDASTTITPGLAVGNMFEFYQFGAQTFNGTGSLATSFATAKPGGSSLIFALGYTDASPAIFGAGDTGYFYTQFADNAPAIITSYGGMKFTANNTGSTIIPNNVFDPLTLQVNAGPTAPFTSPVMEDLYLESHITPNTHPAPPASPWNLYSSDPAITSVLVPVPASVWTGLSMLGVMGGIAAIRRRKALQA